jgi:methionine-rich copper-binding protein CopC
MQDTAVPTIRTAREANSREIDVRTSRAVPALSALFLAASGDSVRQIDAFPDSTGSEVWRVFPRDSLRAGQWTVLASGTDNLGKMWHGQDTLTVRAAADTSHPHLVQSNPAPRAMLRTVPSSLHLNFDKPLVLDSLSAADFRLSAKADSDTVLIRYTPRLPHSLDISPVTPLVAGKSYKLRINGRHVCDYAGHALSDTTTFLPFSIYSPDSLGGLKGELETKVNAQYIYRMLIVKNHLQTARVIAPGPGPFEVPMLPVGKYLCEVTRDVNHDSTYSYGSMWPFAFSEPFLTSPDTIAIRVRWEYDTKIIWQDNH